MITKEFVLDKEFYAVDVRDVSCHGCHFDGDDAHKYCVSAYCATYQRSDGRNVHFLPLDDVRTTMVYAAQQADDLPLQS